MKTAKRFISLGIAMLLVCALLTACVSQQKELSPSQQTGSSAPQQDLSELDMIKAEWQRYVVDRTEETVGIAVGRWSLSNAMMFAYEQVIIDEVLNLCQTLDFANVSEIEDPSDTWTKYDLAVVLLLRETPQPRYFSIFIYKNGEAYVNLVQGEESKENTEYWAYIGNWQIYEQLKVYDGYMNTKGG